MTPVSNKRREQRRARRIREVLVEVDAILDAYARGIWGWGPQDWGFRGIVESSFMLFNGGNSDMQYRRRIFAAILPELDDHALLSTWRTARFEGDKMRRHVASGEPGHACPTDVGDVIAEAA